MLDRRGRVLTQYVPVWSDFSGNGRTAWINRTFDRWDNVLTQGHLNNGGWITTYRYNALNQVILEQKPAVEVWTEQGAMYGANPTTTVYYDAWGRQIGVTDAAGRTNTRRYDGLGRLTNEYFVDGGRITYGYDNQNRETSKTDQIGRVYTYVYDKANQRTEDWVTAGGIAYKLASRRFDELGNRIADTTGQGSVFANATTAYYYDARGKVVIAVRPDGSQTNYVYDARGNTTVEYDGAWQPTYTTYDYFGRLVGKTDIGGAAYTFGYNLAGQLTTQTNTRGQNLAYYYYANGLVRQINDNWRSSYSQYDYDFAGNRTRDIFVEDGSIYRYAFNTYDSNDRLTSVIDNNYTPDVNASRYTLYYRYDANGNKRQVFGSYLQATGGRVNVDNVFAYDAMNRVTVENGIYANGTVSLQDYRSYQYSYDSAGRRMTSRYKSPARPAASGWGTTYGQATTYSYDFADRVLKTYAADVDVNGTAFGQRLRIETVYDPNNGRQTSFREGKVQKDMEGMPFVDRRYISDKFFDANGRLVDDIQWVEGAVMEGYVVSTATFNPDTNSYGWILSRTTYGYDAAGNLAGIRTDAYKENEKSYSGKNLDTGQNYSFKKFQNTSYVASTYYQYTYAKMDGYRERYVSSTSNVYQANTTYEMYDVNGQLLHTFQSQNPAYSAAWYITDHAGHIVQKLALPGAVFNAMPDYAPETAAGAIPGQQGRPLPAFLTAPAPPPPAPAPPPPAPVPAPPPPAPAPPPPGPSYPHTYLFAGEALYQGVTIQSVSGIYRLVHQTDGNVVVYRNDTNIPVWWTGTNGQATNRLVMQTDGNLVHYRTDGSVAWASWTHNNPGAYLAMQDDGNLVIYSSGGVPLWYTNTVGAGAPPPPAPPPPPPSGGGGGGGGIYQEQKASIDPVEDTVMAGTTSLPTLFKPALPPAPPPPSGTALLPPEFGDGIGDNELVLAEAEPALYLAPPEAMGYAKPTTPGSGYWQQFFFANDVGVGTRGYGYTPIAPYGYNLGSFDYTGLGKVQSTTENSATYTVRGTETLRDVARGLYGDETLWYVIAEANGLIAPDGLVAGTTLKIPSVTRASTPASTFKVYNAGELIGSTAPDQLAPPPPPSNGKGGCGGVGMIIMVVVAVVVTVITAGAAAAALAPTLTVGAGGAAIGSASVSVWAAGAAALSGGLAGAGAAGVSIAAAAIGGAVGSIAGQAVGITTGVQEEFSWKNVGLAALGAGVTAGLGGITSGITEGLKDFAGGKYLAAAANGVIRSTVTQGLGSALGLQAFEWRAAAVSAVTAPLNLGINGQLGGAVNQALGSSEASRFALDALNGIAAQAVRMQVYSDGKVDWSSIAADAFANALGNSIVGALQAGRSRNELVINELSLQERVEQAKQVNEKFDQLVQQFGGDTSKIPQSELAPFYEFLKNNNRTYERSFPKIEVASADESTTAQIISELKKNTAIATGYVSGIFQGVGDSVIGLGGLFKDALQTNLYIASDGKFGSQESYYNMLALGEAVANFAANPIDTFSEALAYRAVEVRDNLDTAQSSGNFDDWFLYGASVGRMTFDAMSMVGGVAAVGKSAGSLASVFAQRTAAVSAAETATASWMATPGKVGGFTRTTTPWERNVWQRADIDWPLTRPDGMTNLEAASQGLSPMRRIGEGFEKVELHHLNQNPQGSLAEVFASTHREVSHNVPPPSWRVTDPAANAAFRREVPAYWKWRADRISGGGG